MKLRPILVAAFLASTCLGGVSTAAPKSPGETAKALNQQAKHSLGVSIRALAYLFDAEPGSVLAMQSQSLQQSWHHLEDLERVGLVKLHKFGGAGTDYLRIELTPKGEAVVRELHGP